MYVDDLLITSFDSTGIKTLKAAFSQEFEMKDLGLMTKFLGTELIQTSQGILFH